MPKGIGYGKSAKKAVGGRKSLDTTRRKKRGSSHKKGKK